MQKQLTILLCLTLAVTLLTGCGKQDSSEGSVSSSIPMQSAENSMSAESDADAETPSYNGTFNETVFEQVCKDIRVADSTITVPGTLKDCGSHFSAEFVMQDEKNEMLTYRMLYDGIEIGFVIYIGNSELDKKELETATFYSLFFYNDDGLPDISVGGISLSDPPDRVPEVFGETTDYKLDDDGFGYWQYKLRKEYYLKFTQWDDKFYNIGLSAFPETSDLNPDPEESKS